MTLQEIYEKLKCENARSVLKHGSWKGFTDTEQFRAIMAEVGEWNSAWFAGDVHGEHGEITEALHVMNVLARRIMYLTGEDQ